MKGELGEGTQLNFEKLPYTGLSKVQKVKLDDTSLLFIFKEQGVIF